MLRWPGRPRACIPTSNLPLPSNNTFVLFCEQLAGPRTIGQRRAESPDSSAVAPVPLHCQSLGQSVAPGPPLFRRTRFSCSARIIDLAELDFEPAGVQHRRQPAEKEDKAFFFFFCSV